MKKTSKEIWHDVEYGRESRGVNWWFSENEFNSLKSKLEEANKILDSAGSALYLDWNKLRLCLANEKMVKK